MGFFEDFRYSMHNDIFSAPFGIFYMRTEISKKKFQKKSYTSPNGVLPICKLPFPNGSYGNGVCRGLWAMLSCQKLWEPKKLSFLVSEYLIKNKGYCLFVCIILKRLYYRVAGIGWPGFTSLTNGSTIFSKNVQNDGAIFRKFIAFFPFQTKLT